METRIPDEPQAGPRGAGAGGAEGSTVARVKAPTGKRVIAALIDGGVSFVLGFIPVIGWLLAAAYWLLRDGLDLSFMKQRSVGKQLMGLRPVTLDGRPVDLTVSVMRNWPLAVGGVASFLVEIPFVGWLVALPVALVAFGLAVVELVMALMDEQGRRIGDRTGNTQVVEG